MAQENAVTRTSKIRRNPDRVPPTDHQVNAMMKSIQAVGKILKPIDVIPVGDGYEIDDGEVRWLAAIGLEMDIVPINVVDLDREVSAIDSIIMSTAREELAPSDVVSSLEALVNEFGENAAELVYEKLVVLQGYTASAPELRDRIIVLLSNCGITAEV
jgi:ParB family chromosome partitioning protein